MVILKDIHSDSSKKFKCSDCHKYVNTAYLSGDNLEIEFCKKCFKKREAKNA